MRWLDDPSHFNDRLLLGLKGTMSEAELHMLRARLTGGMMNKARRGELQMRPPIGYAYDGNHHLAFDPDVHVQSAVRLLFETFQRIGSACQVVKHFSENSLLWPRRMFGGPKAATSLRTFAAVSRHAGVAQPSLCGRLCFWTDPFAKGPRWQISL